MRLQWIISQVGQGLRRNLSMVISIILVTFVSLMFVGSAGLLQRQVGLLEDDWHGLVEVSVFLCPQDSLAPQCAGGAVTSERIEQLQGIIDSELGGQVAVIHFESQEDAFRSFVQANPDGVFHGTQLTVDDMQAAFRLELVDPQYIHIVSDTLAGREGVEEIFDQREIFNPLFQTLNMASLLAAGLALVMLVTAALLIVTTIRLSAVSRRKETGIMRLVGASNTMIQLPFLLEGAIAAIIGSLLAVGGLWLAVRFIITDWLQHAVGWVQYIGSADVLAVAPVLVGIAALLAIASSFVSLHRYTRV